jgi:hypothetical protein
MPHASDDEMKRRQLDPEKAKTISKQFGESYDWEKPGGVRRLVNSLNPFADKEDADEEKPKK